MAHCVEASGFACVEAVLGLVDGDVVTLPGGWCARRKSGFLEVEPEDVKDVAPPEMPIAVPGEVRWGSYRI
ncbi:MAG: hypothetical protein IJK04_08625, partial [Kiritimatiellae bacterium]|nr:hypothetical protein [Kiritimatiellia bacterium]